MICGKEQWRPLFSDDVGGAKCGVCHSYTYHRARIICDLNLVKLIMLRYKKGGGGGGYWIALLDFVFFILLYIKLKSKRNLLCLGPLGTTLKLHLCSPKNIQQNIKS